MQSAKSASSADTLPRLDIRRVKLSTIKAAAYNPRKQLRPGDAEWDDLVRSVQTFGYVDPLIWNKRTGNLVGGHQRLSVLTHLYPAMKTVEVSVVTLDDAREKALNLALNKVKGAWDDVRLASLLKELDGTEVARLTGFSEAEMKAITKEGERLVELLVPPPAADDEEDGNEGDDEDEEEGEGGKAKKSVAEVWQVVVECGGEREQKKVFERMSKEGFTCKLLTM